MATLKIVTKANLINTPLLARNLQIGSVFRTEGYEGDSWYMVIRLGSGLQNSGSYKDHVARGDIVILNVISGLITFVEGDARVKLASVANFYAE
jgi:hypothetical protein